MSELVNKLQTILNYRDSISNDVDIKSSVMQVTIKNNSGSKTLFTGAQAVTIGSSKNVLNTYSYGESYTTTVHVGEPFIISAYWDANSGGMVIPSLVLNGPYYKLFEVVLCCDDVNRSSVAGNYVLASCDPRSTFRYVYPLLYTSSIPSYVWYSILMPYYYTTSSGLYIQLN